MDSHSLKISDHDNVQEAKAIRDTFREHDEHGQSEGGERQCPEEEVTGPYYEEQGQRKLRKSVI